MLDVLSDFFFGGDGLMALTHWKSAIAEGFTSKVTESRACEHVQIQDPTVGGINGSYL